VFHREDLYGHQILTKTLKHTHAGDFLISKMQVVHGAMALVTPEFDGMQISGSYIALVSKNRTKLDIRFFDWLSRTQDMYRRAYQCSYGVHIEKMTFNFGLFLKELVVMPTSVEEQTMIADAMDIAQSEERWYEGEVERLQSEKKALMQQLLTGNRRVTIHAQ
jgi:type I restriction enzyme S subunit